MPINGELTDIDAWDYKNVLHSPARTNGISQRHSTPSPTISPSPILCGSPWELLCSRDVTSHPGKWCLCSTAIRYQFSFTSHHYNFKDFPKTSAIKYVFFFQDIINKTVNFFFLEPLSSLIWMFIIFAYISVITGCSSSSLTSGSVLSWSR